jgi:hypothetical protein
MTGAPLDAAVSTIAPSIDFMVDGFSLFATGKFVSTGASVARAMGDLGRLSISNP